MAPEALLKLLHDDGVDVREMLATALSGGNPNAVHVAVTAALSRGAKVWTPNADELIERAAGWSARSPQVATWHPEAAPGNLATASLLKPHGTISAESLAFRSDQVLRPLQGPWRQRLLDDFACRHVVVAGYAGADTDLRPAPAEAISGSASTTWFELPGGVPLLERRFRSLVEVGVLSIVETSTPSADFVRWLGDHGMAHVGRIPHALSAQLDRTGQRAPLEFPACPTPWSARVRVSASIGTTPSNGNSVTTRSRA